MLGRKAFYRYGRFDFKVLIGSIKKLLPERFSRVVRGNKEAKRKTQNILYQQDFCLYEKLNALKLASTLL